MQLTRCTAVVVASALLGGCASAQVFAGKAQAEAVAEASRAVARDLKVRPPGSDNGRVYVVGGSGALEAGLDVPSLREGRLRVSGSCPDGSSVLFIHPAGAPAPSHWEGCADVRRAADEQRMLTDIAAWKIKAEDDLQQITSRLDKAQSAILDNMRLAIFLDTISDKHTESLAMHSRYISEQTEAAKSSTTDYEDVISQMKSQFEQIDAELSKIRAQLDKF